jgi:hypothetical protein
MGKSPRSAQNGEVPSEIAAPARQRPEEILAQTLSVPPHPEATDEWSSRGRRIFLIAMAVAGVVLVVAGLLVTKELGPGPGHPTPVESGPGNGLANQLLQSSAGDQPPATAQDTPVGGILPSVTPATRPARAGGPSPSSPSASPALPTQPVNGVQSTTGTTTPPPSPTTTIPCGGLLGQSLQQTQIPLPCRAPTRSPLG